MLFNSIEFLIFIVPVLALYLLCNHRLQNWLLIIASIIFYACWNWKFLFIMLISISTDYFCSIQIDKSNNPHVRKRYLVVSIIVNLTILGFFKYFNFFTSSAIEFLKMLGFLPESASLFINIILPLGISFYTFEAISYTVDVYRKVSKPARSYPDYLLFVIYFPHLIAGPIMRAKSFLPQVINPRQISWEAFAQGGYLFFWGLFEKMFVADNLAKLVNPIFAKGAPYNGGEVLLALYAFAFQIFCDFDGYSNMARGLGKCMGFDLAINFKWPYFSCNPREFWQRWHITLSAWLRDYLYIPLGGNRFGRNRMFFALMLTMLLGGLWHGASWTFVLWGFYHGLLLVIYRIFSKDSDSSQNNDRKKSFVQAFFFFHLVVLGWLFFRAQSIAQVGEMIKAVIFHTDVSSIDWSSWLKLAGFLAPLLLIQAWQYAKDDLMIIYKQHWFYKTIIYATMTYLLIGWGVLNANEFIYFQF